MAKILVNAITLDNANLAPLLINVKYWQKSGSQVAFFAAEPLKPKIKNFNIISLADNHRLATPKQLILFGLIRNLKALFSVKKIINQFDCIYSRSSVLDLIILPFFLKLFDPKIIWATVFDNTVSLKTSPFLSWLFHQISLLLLKKADVVFVPTLLLKKQIKFKNVVVTGNGIENNLIQKAKGKKYLYNAIFLGRINRAKGINDLLKIANHIKNIAVVGDGNPKLIKKLKSHPNINFLGPQFGLKKFKLLKSSKIFIFPSYTESFGIALLEAVCCGLPAVAYDLPIYHHLYKDKEIITVRKGNVNAMVKKIKKILAKGQSSSGQKIYKNPAGQKLLHKYSWSKIAQIELSAISALLTPPKPDLPIDN